MITLTVLTLALIIFVIIPSALFPILSPVFTTIGSIISGFLSWLGSVLDAILTILIILALIVFVAFAIIGMFQGDFSLMNSVLFFV